MLNAKYLFILGLFFALCTFPATGSAAISPSQVLVLYNADWTDDAPLTGPGQDSQEIADHYLAMHTNPITGEKPYLLGLHCDHGIKILDELHHLNASHLEEESQDNRSGVIYSKRGWLDEEIKDDQLRDSRLIEFVFPDGREKWQVETLQLTLTPDKAKPIVLVKDGLIETPGKVAGKSTDEWTIRLNGKTFSSGLLTLNASCYDQMGKEHHWQTDYVDVDDVKLSRTGLDGQHDDQNFIEDVTQPLRAFLENPENARPDGTLLKDHILFIVVSYGLPRTAIAPDGIARGITDRINNFGSIIDFGQRLQLLYYDLEGVQKGGPKPYKFANKGGFSDYFFRSPQAWPLYGVHANPFVHPQLYQKNKPSLDELSDPLQFNQQNRNKFSNRHLYFVMRIDAPDPLQARGLIDRAVYASKSASSTMGETSPVEPAKMKARVGRSKTGQWLAGKGFTQLYYGGQGKDHLAFFRLGSDGSFFNSEPVYLPGGVGGTVISHNGWKKGEMIQDLAQGVTATIGAAKVYRGAPHIHNKSWWDDEILYPYLLKGRTLGEVFLMNQVHLGWISTFIGDPLYRLPETVVNKSQPPTFDVKSDVQVEIIKNKAGDKEVWLQVDLGTTADLPMVGQLKAVSPTGVEVICPTFEAKPYVLLGDKTVCGQTWQLETIGPYKQRYAAKVLIECDGD